MSAALPPGAFSAGPYANGIRCLDCDDGFHALTTTYHYKKPEDGPEAPSLVCQSCGGKRWGLNVPGRRINMLVWWHPMTWFVRRSWQWAEVPPTSPPPPPPSDDPDPEPDPTPTTSLPVNAPEWLKV